LTRQKSADIPRLRAGFAELHRQALPLHLTASAYSRRFAFAIARDTSTVTGCFSGAHPLSAGDRPDACLHRD